MTTITAISLMFTIILLTIHATTAVILGYVIHSQRKKVLQLRQEIINEPINVVASELKRRGD